MRRLVAVAIVAGMLTGPVSTEDWPQFRGPGGQGHSAETGLPFEWSESRNIRWKVPVEGRGWSSPVVAGGRVWLTTATTVGKDTSLRLLAFEIDTGKATVDVEVFKLRGGGQLNPKNSLASPTPIVDGDRVYVHFGADGTAAVTTDGKVAWKVVLAYQSQHGNGGSPALYEDLLIVNCDGGDEAYVVALDKATGRVRWRAPRRQPFDQSYTTPLVINVAGADQLVSIGAYRATAYEPRTGREIWRVSYGSGF